MVTDPIADMINRLKTASHAGLSSVSLPHSRLRVSIADLLKKEGVIASFETEGKEVKKNIIITLSSKPISGAVRISKPSRRVYAKADEIGRLSRRQGLLAISTPKGVISGRNARKEKVGGEVLFRLW